MIAASYWSLLSPAIEMAVESKVYGEKGEYAFAPVALGFLIGAAFVYGTDALISSLGVQSPNVVLAMQSVGTKQRRKILAKLKSDQDIDENIIVSEVNVSGGKVYSDVESTTIDGRYFSFNYTCINRTYLISIIIVALGNGIGITGTYFENFFSFLQ